MASVALIAVGAFCLFVSFAGWALFGWAAHERTRFDPIWDPVLCEPIESVVRPVSFVVPLTLADGRKPNMSNPADASYIQMKTNATTAGWITKKCTNMNQMELMQETWQDGPAWVRPQGSNDLISAGTSYCDGGVLPIGGSGQLSVVSNFTLGMPTVLALVAKGGNCTVYTKLYWRATSTLTMLGKHVKSETEYERYCGFRAKFDLTKSLTGPTVCGENLEQLVVPDYTQPSVAEYMTLSEERMKKGEKGRDMACGMVMGIGLIFFCCCCCSGAGCMHCGMKGKSVKTAPSTERTPVEAFNKDDVEQAGKLDNATAVVCVAR